MANSDVEPRSRRRSRPTAFDRFLVAADRVTHALGTPWSLLAALLIVAVWGLTGPVFGFSDTWQLIINTGTTIVTFLMVFVIQTSQNRESKAIHLKLDELIRATPGARTAEMIVEKEPEKELERQAREYERLAERARRQASRGSAKATPGTRPKSTRNARGSAKNRAR